MGVITKRYGGPQKAIMSDKQGPALGNVAQPPGERRLPIADQGSPLANGVAFYINCNTDKALGCHVMPKPPRP